MVLESLMRSVYSMFSIQRQIVFLSALGILLATFLLGAYTSTGTRTHSAILKYFSSENQPNRQLHLLLPATASTLNFCRLLLSSTVTGYPDPIIIGWDGHGLYDGAKSHLFKISETLAYLNNLPASNDDDLVLLIDAYDVWLILRPEVMISRYFELLQRSNERLQSTGLHGRMHGGAEIRNTLFWGPDKVCWPTENQRAACWAVPDSPLPKNAFGPDTDAWMVLNRQVTQLTPNYSIPWANHCRMSRPRWLNSGTLIGPVRDMRDMFNATMQKVLETFDEKYEYKNSDQYYFQNVWGEQEVERTKLRTGEIHSPLVGFYTNGNPLPGQVPKVPTGRRTEYHISIDYNATLFQTAAGKIA